MAPGERPAASRMNARMTTLDDHAPLSPPRSAMAKERHGHGAPWPRSAIAQQKPPSPSRAIG